MDTENKRKEIVFVDDDEMSEDDNTVGHEDVFQLLKYNDIRCIGADSIKVKKCGIQKFLRKTLKKHNIKTLFSCQTDVIPNIIKLVDNCSFIQRDVIVESPTGSGKTLCYVLPIIETLSRYIVRKLRALIVLPTRELALQVYDVFQLYCADCKLNVGLSVGSNNFGEEQKRLIKNFNKWDQNLISFQVRNIPIPVKKDKLKMAVDILVTTPGRLIDHMEKTDGFTLQGLNFIVIDEVDRLIRQQYMGWLAKVQKYTSKFLVQT
eukprot:UN26442